MDQDRLLRERLSRLGEAGLRINESLKFETVLQGVLNSPCALTEARYGALTPDLLTPGLTSEEAQGLRLLPEGRMFFELVILQSWVCCLGMARRSSRGGWPD